MRSEIDTDVVVALLAGVLTGFGLALVLLT